uniref:Mitochondrial import receptor subunit TOM20 n=1 Tax=Ceratitis capitata TaxID=7213 RepID=W8BPM5_CERCA
MNTINRTTIGIAAGVAGTLFIAYCIYFDGRRRADPDYKKKVHERRRRLRKNRHTAGHGIPNLSSQQAIERYFLQELKMGEELIERQEYENAVAHFANAVLVCGDPGRLLEMLQHTMPAQVFAILIIKMQEIGNRARAEMNEAAKAAGVKRMENADEDEDATNAALIDDLE